MSSSPHDDVIKKTINQMIYYSSQEVTDHDLIRIDDDFRKFIGQNPGQHQLLFYYNEFRIANIDKLPKTRPHILIGGPFSMRYPNFHHYSLFELADVICLVNNPKGNIFHSAFLCQPTTLFFDILKKLPKSFKPDFYWDNQVEHNHFIPFGIELAPFPIIASICHTFVHKTVENICELFDRVIPVSKYHGDLLRKKYPDKIFDLPFGLNWASFDLSNSPDWGKSIDVSVTFQNSDFPAYCGHRNKILELAQDFQNKYGHKYSIKIYDKLSIDDYNLVTKKSRISINVTGVNGPYNYRTVEAMVAGTMLFQYDWEDPVFKNHFSELFLDGVHGIGFNTENFESKLLYYLENPKLIEDIAKNAYAYIKENFSYRNLYQRLITAVSEIDIVLPRQLPQYAGYNHTAMIYFNQCSPCSSYMQYGILSSFNEVNWTKYNNLMIQCCTIENHAVNNALLVSMSEEIIKSLKSFDNWSLISKFYELALDATPKQYNWIVQWNFFIIKYELGRALKSDIENIIDLLENTDPEPFDELKVYFKYFVDSENESVYPCDWKNFPFIQFNIDLIRDIDNPKLRAHLHQDYALNAAKHFYSIAQILKT